MKELFRNGKLQSNPFLNLIELIVIVFALWFIMSEIVEAKFLLYGVLSAVIISIFCAPLLIMDGQKSDNCYFLINCNIFRMAGYFFYLVIEIIKAAIYVSKVVLFERDKVSPKIVWFKADYDNPAASALLANSITLTPGTITIDISDDGIYAVHALTDELAEGVCDGSMQAKVASVYGETIDFSVVEAADETIPEGHGKAKLISTRFKGSGKEL